MLMNACEYYAVTVASCDILKPMDVINMSEEQKRKGTQDRARVNNSVAERDGEILERK